MKRYISLLLLVSSMAFAQAHQIGTVMKWELRPYSQSAHITRDHVVYSVQVGNVRYQIARRSRNVEMNTGQQIECRLDKTFMFVRNVKGKETKYQIVGTD